MIHTNTHTQTIMSLQTPYCAESLEETTQTPSRWTQTQNQLQGLKVSDEIWAEAACVTECVLYFTRRHSWFDTGGCRREDGRDSLYLTHGHVVAGLCETWGVVVPISDNDANFVKDHSANQLIGALNLDHNRLDIWGRLERQNAPVKIASNKLPPYKERWSTMSSCQLSSTLFYSLGLIILLFWHG